jgi:hypothetical protein
MAWATIRKATEEDVRKLDKRAQAFIERHDLQVTGILRPTDAVEEQQDEGRRLNRLWLAIVCRALGDARAEGIAYGYVGYVVD